MRAVRLIELSLVIVHGGAPPIALRPAPTPALGSDTVVSVAQMTVALRPSVRAVVSEEVVCFCEQRLACLRWALASLRPPSKQRSKLNCNVNSYWGMVLESSPHPVSIGLMKRAQLTLEGDPPSATKPQNDRCSSAR